MRPSRNSPARHRARRKSPRDRRALIAVQIARDLIAFDPQAIHEPQPYVILLDTASGILKRLDL